MTVDMHALENNLGPSLRRWRVLNRVKQQALAAELGVSQSKISRWESGQAQPERIEMRKILKLLRAHPQTSADNALLDLVTRSEIAVHLVCDLTHRLLAVSPKRAEDWHIPLAELMNQPLWRFASDGIRTAENRLGDCGWFEPQAPDIVFKTERAEYPEITIPARPIRITRLPLSDGCFARLVRDEPIPPA
ncbi:MAG: helix-turn-helix transcriptional regulator [Roseibium sp.]